MLEPAMLFKFLHVVSSAVLFGSIFGVCIFVSLAALSGRAILADVARLGSTASWITAVALIVQPLTGAVLIKLQEDAPMQPWLVAAYALYAVVLIAWVSSALVLRRIGLPSLGGGRSIGLWAILSWGSVAVLVAIYFLMLAQPALWGRVG